MIFGRLLAVLWRESLEISRDRFRLWSMLFSAPLLLIVFGFGLSLDIENLPYAVLDQDNTSASRSYLEPFEHSQYFAFQGSLQSPADLERGLVGGDLAFVIDVPPGFHRDLTRDATPRVAIWVDGTMPFRASLIAGYAEAMHRAWLRNRPGVAAARTFQLETRYRYNEGLRSAVAFVPGLIAILLVMFPAIFTAMGVVREKEEGSIVSLYATPVGRLEFLLGKQIPSVVLGLVQFVALAAIAFLVFDVPIRGDPTCLLSGAILYLWATTGIGLVVSCVTRSQISALLITMILVLIPAWIYSGFFIPVSGLTGGARAIAFGFPTTYFLHVCVGVFVKGLGWVEVWPDLLRLVLMATVLDLAAFSFLRTQER